MLALKKIMTAIALLEVVIRLLKENNLWSKQQSKSGRYEYRKMRRLLGLT
jgi:hypothetical protein